MVQTPTTPQYHQRSDSRTSTPTTKPSRQFANFNDNNDLSAKISDTYWTLDDNNSGGLSFVEFRDGGVLLGA